MRFGKKLDQIGTKWEKIEFLKISFNTFSIAEPKVTENISLKFSVVITYDLKG